jgi:hypothetical protein
MSSKIQTDENGNPMTYWGGLSENKSVLEDTKQLAVSFLLDEMFNKKELKIISMHTFYIPNALGDKAKAMERERIIEAYKVAFSIDKNYVSDEIAQLSAENYYKETYEQ